jgi:hypothetical protein
MASMSTMPLPRSAVRVAYITCDTPAWVELASAMRQRRGWTPIYWIAEPYMRDVLRSRFPGVVVHSRYDAYHLISPPELDTLTPAPLDQDFLNALAEEQVIAMKMMDVMDSVDAFDFNARRRFFHQRLRYWRAILEEIGPDVAMFGFSPHVVYDYAIYVLCRRMGVRTMMFEATFNFGLLFAFEDHMVGSLELKDRYQELLDGAAADRSAEPLPPLFETYLARVRGKYDEAMPWYMRDQLNTMPKNIAAGLYRGSQPSTAEKRLEWRHWLQERGRRFVRWRSR